MVLLSEKFMSLKYGVKIKVKPCLFKELIKWTMLRLINTSVCAEQLIFVFEKSAF
jgi:hypothetical protein